MNDVMGIIKTGGIYEGLKELTISRSSAAIPFGGRYRIIDFILSDMVNSGIRNVGVITQNNYHSLMDHLGSGKEWDLDRKKDGLFILPPYVTTKNSGWYRGSVDALYNNISYIRRSIQKYTLLSGSNSIYNTSFDEMLDFHIAKKADITVMYKKMDFMDRANLSKYGIIDMNNRSRIVDIEEKPKNPKTLNVLMDVCILERELLKELVEEAYSRGRYEWVKDILIEKFNKLKIYGYCYQGHWDYIDNIKSYYNASIDMLNSSTREELFPASRPIYTKIKDEPPAKYKGSSRVINSIVADGSVIEGEVINSIIFRGVNIKKGAIVKNSIIMQNTVVGERSELDCVILDKDVCINSEKRIIGQSNFPIALPKKMVI